MNDMKWTEVNGINKVTEESDKIAARQSDSGFYIAYMAYGGVKVVELSGIDGICRMEDTSADEAKIEAMTSGDWEAAVPVIIGEHKVTLSINDSDEFKLITEAENIPVPALVSSEQYEVEEWDDIDTLYDECPFLEGLADVLELI